MQCNHFLTASLLAALALPAFVQARPLDQADAPEAVEVELEQLEIEGDNGPFADQDRSIRVRVNGEEIELDALRPVNGEELDWVQLEVPQMLDLVNQAPQMVEATRLGVAGDPVSPELAKRIGIEHATGLKLSFIAPDSPAAKAGLKQGDVLLKLNDQILINMEQLAVLVRTFKPGDKVKLHAHREGEMIEVEAELDQDMLPPVGPGGAQIDRQGWRVQRQNIRPILVDPFEAHQGHLDERILNQRQAHQELMEKMIREMNERQNQQELRMQELLQRLELDLDGIKGEIQGGADMKSQVMLNDGEHAITLTTDNDDRHLTVKAADGEVLFDGKVPEGGKIEGLDPELQEKIDDMLKNKFKAKTIDLG